MTLPQFPTIPTVMPGQPWTSALFNAVVGQALSFLGSKPFFFGYQGTNQSLANGTLTAISLDQTAYDTYGGHSNTVNPSRYVCQYAGIYHILAQVSWPTNATGNRAVEIYKNGTVFTPGTQTAAAGAANWTITQTGLYIPLAVGDYVEVFGQQSSGGALTPNNGSAPYHTWMQAIFAHL
jgi:hypothetical protein